MSQARKLSECLESVDTPAAKRRVADYLAALPFPQYEAAPGRSGLLIRVDEDGTRTLGEFVNRRSQKAPPGVKANGSPL